MSSVRGALTLLLALTAGCSAIADSQQPPRTTPTVRLLHTWGIGPAVTQRLQSELASSLRDLRVELAQTDLSIDALAMLQRREVDAVFTFATFAYMASTGQLAAVKMPKDIRAIAELSSRPVQVIVRDRSAIRSVADLGGHRLSIGPIGSNANLVAQRLLIAFGIAPGAFTAEHYTLGDASRHFVAGEIDAFFANGYAYREVAEALAQGGRLLHIEGPEIDRARMIFPLLRPTVLPAGTYAAVGRPVHTVGVDEILLCRADLEERMAHELARAFVEVVARRDLEIDALRFTDLNAAALTAIPLHPGAARYFREREVLP